MPENQAELDGNAKTIFTVFDHTVKRMDWVQVIADVHQQARVHPGTVHIIHDFRPIQYRMMPTSLRHALQLARNIPENIGAYIVLTNSRLIEFVGQTVINLLPQQQHKISFTSTPEAAEKIIAQIEQAARQSELQDE